MTIVSQKVGFKISFNNIGSFINFIGKFLKQSNRKNWLVIVLEKLNWKIIDYLTRLISIVSKPIKIVVAVVVFVVVIFVQKR